MGEHDPGCDDAYAGAAFAESHEEGDTDIDLSAPRPLGERILASLVTISAVLGTTALGIGPLLGATVLFGRHIGTPLGAATAAGIMWLILVAVLRAPDRPSAAFAGIVAFSIGTLMTALAVMELAVEFIPSQPTGAIIGVVGGLGAASGLVVWAKRRYELWKDAQGHPAAAGLPPPVA